MPGLAHWRNNSGVRSACVVRYSNEAVDEHAGRSVGQVLEGARIVIPRRHDEEFDPSTEIGKRRRLKDLGADQHSDSAFVANRFRVVQRRYHTESAP